MKPSEEQSERVESGERCARGRRGGLPGVPGGPALRGRAEPVICDEVLDALLAGAALPRR